MIKTNPIQREFLCCFTIAIVTLFGYTKITAHSLYSSGITFFENYCSFSSINCSRELKELDTIFVVNSDFERLVLFGEQLLFKENAVNTLSVDAASAKRSLEGVVNAIRDKLSKSDVVSTLFWMYTSKVFLVITIGYLVFLSPVIVRESTVSFTGCYFREVNKFLLSRCLVILTTSLAYTMI